MKEKQEVLNGLVSRFGSEMKGLWENGYYHGYQDRDNDLRAQTELVDELKLTEYQRGYRDGEHAKEQEWIVPQQIEAYNKGYQDGLLSRSCDKSFSVVKEIQKKLEDSEKKQKMSNDPIQLGDEVMENDKYAIDTRGVVIAECPPYVDVIWADGTIWEQVNPKNLEKTGNRFPQILDIKKALQEGGQKTGL